MKNSSLTIWFATQMAVFALPVSAETQTDPWRNCNAVPTSFQTVTTTREKSFSDDAPWVIDSSEAEYQTDGLAIFSGRVIATRNDRVLRAKEIRYDSLSDQIDALGDVAFEQSGVIFFAPSAKINTQTEHGSLTEVNYTLTSRHAHGEAASVNLLGKNLSYYEDTSYTTCAPGDNDWVMFAGELELDQSTGLGTAKHVRLDAVGIPVFYSPWFQFPIDDRRISGILPPSIGNSQSDGFSLTVPYYWNIAPDMDATITPTYLSRRGTVFGNELRTLTEHTENTVELAFISDDRQTGDSRGMLGLFHQGRYSSEWSSKIDARYVTDDEWMNDFGSGQARLNHLRRRADLNYKRPTWSMRGRLQYFQTLDPTLGPTQRPYQSLPQLVFKSEQPLEDNLTTVSVDAEAVHFERNDTVTGDRLTLSPKISWLFETPASFVRPSLSINHRQYYLDDPTDAAVDRESRTIPQFSFDSGLFFERPSNNGDSLQTLEPRLYYLYVPNRDQSDIPIFDSKEPSFSFARLFEDNRFTGSDRIGDANQLTLALTTRFLNARTGDERLRASIGEIFYYSDREVTLPGKSIETNRQSELVAEVILRPQPDWYTRVSAQWEPDEFRTTKSVFQMRYQPDSDHMLNLAYRHRVATLEQTDISFRLPLGYRWHVVGRHNYSFKENRTLDAFSGFEYDSCCWVFRFLAQRQTDDNSATGEEGYDTALMTQIELKGLSSLGRRVDEFLGSSILGYAEHLE